MKTVYNLLISMAVVFGLTSCDEQNAPDIEEMLASDEQSESSGDALQISKIDFSDDCKEMYLTAKLLHDIGDYDLMDSSKVVAKPHQEVQIMPGKFGEESQPVITKIANPGREELKKQNIKILLLVDLSLPQPQIDAELSAFREIRTLFGHQGIYVSFMQGNNVTETYEATDYIADNYFVHRDSSYVYLYRSVLTKLSEFIDENTTIGKAKHKVFIILSGGKTYLNDKPIDPQHFELQQQLTNLIPSLKNQIWVSYANFTTSQVNNDEIFALSDRTDDSNIIHYLCNDLDGLYQSSFNWSEMETDMLKDFHIDPSEYLITLENPDGKIYRGSLHKLNIIFCDRKSGELITKGSITFNKGALYSPIIVNDISMAEVIIQGILTTLLFLSIVWLVFQFIEPYIRYMLFKRRYVISYNGKKMSVKGLEVAESCYLCKAPFVPGDEIVVKCKHTVHKGCWDENEYHCPEHGRHCKEGSHYYNQQNLFDKSNALFYMKWILLAIVAGFTAWVLFINQDHSTSTTIIQYIHNLYHEISHTTDKDGSLMFVYGSYLSDLPALGQTVGFMLTFFLSYFTVSKRRFISRLAEILLRSILAALAGWFCCLLGSVTSIILHLESSTFIIDWIPWMLLSGIIIIAVTINTRTLVRKSLIITSCMIAVLSMVIWAFVFNNTIFNYRISLLIGFSLYAVAIAICIAKDTPRSERYFLHVEGAIKEMDIALYKWLRNSSDRVVTIGKSVDCSIQLSWDINGNAAPVQAEIRKHKNSLRLTALEEGVYVKNRPLKPGREIWLYHGKRFTIGNTTFTYIEKDLSN